MFGKGLGFLLGRGQYCKHHRVSDMHVIEKSHGLDGRFFELHKVALNSSIKTSSLALGI